MGLLIARLTFYCCVAALVRNPRLTLTQTTGEFVFLTRFRPKSLHIQASSYNFQQGELYAASLWRTDTLSASGILCPVNYASTLSDGADIPKTPCSPSRDCRKCNAFRSPNKRPEINNVWRVVVFQTTEVSHSGWSRGRIGNWVGRHWSVS